MPDPARVGVDARLRNGAAGGVQQVLTVLAQGLRAVGDPRVQPHFIVYRGEHQWLDPHLDPHWSLIEIPAPERSHLSQALTRAPQVHDAARSAWHALRAARAFRRTAEFAPSAVANAGLDLIHFTFQRAFHTELPSIYQPHDLQHEHLPEFFSGSEVRRRRRDYRGFSDAANLVVVGTSWVRDDVIAHLHQPPAKVRVVPLAPAELPPPDGTSLPADLPGAGFLLYPAAAWPHKNHAVLLEALSHLRGQGLVVPAVFPGASGGRADLLRANIDRLKLADQVWLPGFVSDAALSHLYGRARLVCVPSLFESASYPIWEAFRHGVPVAAAAVTALPDQVGDAGLLFDAHDPRALAACIERLWHDEGLRRQLVDRGRHRVARISKETMAARYVALYLEVLGRPLTPGDRSVLEAPVLL